MGPTARKWKLEAKVIWSAATTAGASIGLAVLNDVQADHALLGPTPEWLQTLVIAAAPPLAALLAGWKAKHTPRPDLGPSAGR